jgi:hypothetical protein
MSGWSRMTEPHMAALLTNRCISEPLKNVNEAIGRNSAWQLHAASTGINSSFT